MAPFGGPVVPDVYVRNATSSGENDASGGASSAWPATSDSRSGVPSGTDFFDAARSGGASPARKSSSLVVMATRTGVVPVATSGPATSSQSDSSVTSTDDPESAIRYSSSRALFIGLIDTMTPPA